MGVASSWVHGAKVCIIPHPENNYEPLALRRRSLTLFAAVLLLSKLAALGVLGLTPQTAELSVITTERILQLTNQERVGRGLSALTMSSRLTDAAQQKAKDMLERDYFAHISPSGVTPWFWMAQAGYSYRVAGENLAIDFTEAEDVVTAWMNSPSHRDNLLEDTYAETGLAVLTGEFEGGTSTVVVHMFGTPAVAAAIAPADLQEPAVPSPTPTASPVPARVLPAPRAPRIALQSESTVGTTTAPLLLEAAPGGTVYVLSGEAVVASAGVPESGTVLIDAPLTDVPDGTVLFSAYVRAPDGQNSPLSEAVQVVKDTAGPTLAREHVSFVLSPATDRPRVALIPPALLYAVLTVTAGADTIAYRPGEVVLPAVPLPPEPVVVVAADELGNENSVSGLALTPSFLSERRIDFIQQPTLLGQLSRRLALVVGIAISVLLLGGILIRIRIQRPRMIMHASVLVLLACVFFLW